MPLSPGLERSLLQPASDPVEEDIFLRSAHLGREEVYLFEDIKPATKPLGGLE
jgi:hypothetical protein